MDDFKALLKACVTMKGKFLLSSYPEELLMDYRSKYGWKTEDHKKHSRLMDVEKRLKQKSSV
ncbi:hypothetical protein [Dyadobacter sp. LHD-138]|uniref:hypothetical protein n=1 Tax=Dyadobacter sp. LHD-138 TaxID=3071413 RepID=UPI0027E11156|nr:hypothetical protein [Dyadobacter sp. LHD-138]MDQ6481782.1 hypothetical protein [Dyadobacter sp. LHD-138]